MLDIEGMTTGEWISYHNDLIEQFYADGGVLKPTIGCTNCDIAEDYVCFFCEINQLEKMNHA